MTTRWPGLSTAPSRKPLVCMMADAGTPYLRAMLTIVSPELTVTGEPPSQVQCPVGAGAGRAGTDPVTSDVPGRYAPRPCAPVATPPVLATVAGRRGARGRRARRRQRLRFNMAARRRARRDRAGRLLLAGVAVGGVWVGVEA